MISNSDFIVYSCRLTAAHNSNQIVHISTIPIIFLKPSMSGLQITSHGIVVDGLQLQMEGVFDGSDASKHPEILRRLSEENNRSGIPLPKVGETAASYLKRNQFLYAVTAAEQQPVANPMTPAQQQQGFKGGDLDLNLPNRRLY